MVIFTNGCFDILHVGHVRLLQYAKSLGDKLVVGINSDASVRAIKGPERPIVPQEQRMEMLLALRSVDEVVIFDEPTPLRLLEQIRPAIIVKGDDWKGNVVGSHIAEVRLFPVGDTSTTKIVNKIESQTKKVFVCGSKLIIAHSLWHAMQLVESTDVEPIEEDREILFVVPTTEAWGGKQKKACEWAKILSVGVYE